MTFKKYDSIENSYRQKTLDYIVQQGLSGGEWIVQCKVHGGNFSVWYNDGDIRFAKRSGFIADDENFYSHRRLISSLTEYITCLACDILDSKNVVVYGEIAGGGYEHPDVEKVNTARVQKGVDYNPDVFFYAFDVMVDGEYLCMDLAIDSLNTARFTTAKTLFRGSLADCLDFPNDYQSTIPSYFGLPPIADNICEGNVIKPVEPKFLSSGSRVILKNKNAKFSEKKNAKTKQLKPTNDELQKKYPISFAVLEDISPYITENRLKNVISKTGTINNKDFGKLLGLFVLDVREDAFKDDYPYITKDEEKVFNKQLNNVCSALIRDNFANIIDGNF